MSLESDSVYQFSATRLDGTPQNLSEFAGKVLLIVNTASQCGFTPQFAGLEKIYSSYKEGGFVVLGFPCNQFGAQEPGSPEQITSFCQKNFGVTFPMFAKIDVNGPAAHPLFAFLTQKKPGLLGTSRIKWNFTKFLVDRSGRVISRFAPAKKPESIAPAVERLLREN